MIRTRNTWALALVLCAGLWACDSGGGGKDNPGGNGGGGTGGTGGIGGTGGTGGNETQPECGNGITEEGEQCDDGNLDNGDGCDSNCAEEVGLCTDVIDFRQESTYQAPWRIVTGTLPRGGVSRAEGSCGGEGPEVVYKYRTNQPGYMVFAAADAEGYILDGVSVYVMKDCDLATEVACAANDQGGIEMEVEADNEFYIVIDSIDPLGSDLDYLLVVAYYPLVERGEECDPDGEENICRTGLVCKGNPATCQDGTPPVIQKAALYHGTDPGYIIAEGTDPDEDIVAFTYETLDAQGNPINAVDTNLDGSYDGSSITLSAAAVAQATFGMFGVFGNGDGTWLAALPTYWSMLGLAIVDPSAPVAGIRLTLIDAAGLQNEPYVVYPPRVVEEGGACDNDGYTVCDEGLLCKGNPLTCQPGIAPVIDRGLYADRGEDAGGPIIIVKGSDPDNDVTHLILETLNEEGELHAYDLDGNGTIDADTYTLDMSSRNFEGTFYGAWTIGKGDRVPQLAIQVFDSTGRSSERVVYAIVDMVFKAEGETCDEWGFEPCGTDLTCRGEPLTCHPAEAPVVEGAVYYEEGGDFKIRTLIRDADSDIEALTLTMLNEAGEPTQYDVFGDGLEGPDLDLTDYMACEEDYCFVSLIMTEAFAEIPKVSFVATDSRDVDSEPVVAEKGPRPERAHGEACSVWGFDVCVDGEVCAGEPAVCSTLAELQQAMCDEAPVIEVSGPGSYTATGTATLPSYWDSPAGCSAPYNDPKGMPEGVVVLRLESNAAKVTISTNNNVTKQGLEDGDTVLYVLPGACGADGAALVCNDDIDYQGGVASSQVQLTNVEAGDYLIVVDTWYQESADGAFQVDVTVQ
jgi:cysteine-rich repeat protein